MHTTSKKIELESPGCSDFEENLKIEKPWVSCRPGGQLLIETESEYGDQIGTGENHRDYCIHYIPLAIIGNPNHSSVMECNTLYTRKS